MHGTAADECPRDDEDDDKWVVLYVKHWCRAICVKVGCECVYVSVFFQIQLCPEIVLHFRFYLTNWLGTMSLGGLRDCVGGSSVWKRAMLLLLLLVISLFALIKVHPGRGLMLGVSAWLWVLFADAITVFDKCVSVQQLQAWWKYGWNVSFRAVMQQITLVRKKIAQN